MKIKPFTKEHLIGQLAEIRQSHAEWVSGDERRRKEFAKAFGWYKSSMYASGDTREPLTPSWEEIFTKVGGLLDHVNDNNRLLNIENTLEHFNVQLQELKEKK